MPTTVVYPSLDVSGTGSISTIIGTAASFAGSVTASGLTVTGTATFSGTAVFVGTAQFLATVTFSKTVVFVGGATGIDLDQINNISLSQSVADGQVLTWNNTSNQWINATPAAGGGSGTATVAAFYNKGSLTQSGEAVFLSQVTFKASVTFSATAVFTNMQITTLGITGTASFAAQATFAATATFSATVNMMTALRVSGTASVGVLKIAGGIAGSVLLGSVSFGAVNSIRFSGSWSDYSLLELFTTFKATPSGSVHINVYTDGGTTAVLAVDPAGSATISNMFVIANIFNGGGFKGIRAEKLMNAVVNVAGTATANTGILNALMVSVGTSLTLSSGHAMLYGRRR